MSRLINRMYGRVHGWFDSKDAREVSKPIPAKFSPRARLAFLDLEDRVMPSYYLVTGTGDDASTASAGGDGLIGTPFRIASLRGAITAANANAGADTISFNTNSTLGVDFSAGINVIALQTAMVSAIATTGEFLTITGPGADKLVITRSPISTGVRAFTFQGANEVTVSDMTISGLSSTLTAGGSISFNTTTTAASKLTLNRVAITGNTAATAAVYFNSGTLSLTNSTISGNSSSSATGGGALRVTGLTVPASTNLNLDSCTISNNITAGSGGGMNLTGVTGTVNVRNTTITGNIANTATTSAGSGGGGISRTTTTAFMLNISSSIVTGNSATGANVVDISLAGAANVVLGTFSNSLIGRTTKNAAVTGVVTDPLLSVLGLHQGGSTPVMVPLRNPLSGAVNLQTTGTPPSGANDQTGTNRGALNYDAGSVESVAGVPFAQIPTLPSVFTSGGTSYSFDVYLYDDVGIDSATLDNNDFVVTGPNGPITPVTFVSLTGNNATYSFTPPGGTWEGNDTGFYSITLQANQIKNTVGAGTAIATGFEGAFLVALAQPAVTTVTFNPLLTNPQTDLTFTVKFTDIAGGTGISYASLANTNIRVTGSGFPANTFATFVSSDTGTSDGTPLTATYKITGPGGSFDTAEANQIYTFALEANQVINTAGTYVPAATLGTYAISYPQTITVTTDTDVVDANDGLISLREALITANFGVDSADTINFDSTFFATAKTITLGSLLPTIATNLTINGPASVVTITKPSSIVGNLLKTDRTGGTETVTINNVKLLGTTAFGTFAALDVTNEIVNLTNVTISGTTGTGTGAGIAGTLPTLTITNSLIDSNSTSGAGGGISLNNANTVLTITNTTINNNINSTSGGGIRVVGPSTITITGSTITNNTSTTTVTGLGGGMSIGAGSLVVIDTTTIDSNFAGGSGGGIAMSGTGVGQGLYITNSTISRNTANSTTSTLGGGGIAFGGISGHVASGKAFLVRNSTIAGNTAAQSGGGFLFNGTVSGTLDIQNSTIVNNTAIGNTTTAGTGGGGIAVSSVSATLAATVNVISTILSGNTASGAANTADDGSFVASALLTVASDYNAIADQDDFTTNAAASMSFGTNNLVPTNSTYTALKLTAPSLAAPFGLADNGGTTKTVAIGTGTTAAGMGTNPSTPAIALTTDQTGNPRIQPTAGVIDIGAFERVAGVPTVTGSTFPSIYFNNGTTNPYFFTVTYADDTSIQKSTVEGGTDIIMRVKSSGAFYANAEYVSTTATGNDPSIVATYKVVPPGDSIWDPADNSTYEIFFNGSVLNGDSFPVANTILGQFDVGIGTGFVVDTTSDIVDANDSLTSLREAIIAANTNFANSPDTITFASGLGTAPTLTLTGGELLISNPLTITGTTGRATINGNGARIFNINGPGSIEVSFSNLNLAGATTTSVGGAVQMQNEIVSFTDCDISNNSTSSNGGAIGVGTGSSFLNLTRVTITNNKAGNGGGIDGSGGGTRLIMVDCTVSGNTATGNGGGLSNPYSNITQFKISRSTFSNNRAGTGGAMQFFNGAPTIENSTITGNVATANGGGISITGTNDGSNTQRLSISNTTITSNSAATNGGGIYRANSLTTHPLVLSSTIVAGNSCTASPDIHSTTAVTISGDNNLIGVAGGTFTMGGTANLTGPAKLLPLASNGGVTQTHVLLPSNLASNAVDAGNNLLTLGTDQRGGSFSRTINGLADIGAFERMQGVPVAYPGTFAPITPANVGTSDPYTFTVSYGNEADFNTGSFGNDDIIVTGPNGYSQFATKVTVAQNPDTVGGPNDKFIDVTYTIPAPVGGWIGVGNNPYTFTVQSGAVLSTNTQTVPVTNLGTMLVQLPTTFVVTNTNDAGTGSLRQAILDANVFTGTADTIVFATPLFLSLQTISLTSAEIAITEDVTILGSGKDLLIVDGNGARRIFNINNGVAGGASNFTIQDLTLSNASAAGSGGAVIIQDENVTFTRTTFTGNKATTTGGASISVTLPNNNTLTVEDSLMTLGFASGDGGAIHANNPTSTKEFTLVVRNSTLSNNTVNDDGGALNLGSGANTALFNLLLENSTISGNTCGLSSTSGDGGGIYFRGTVGSTGFIISNSTISGNSANTTGVASVNGGGLGLPLITGNVQIRNSTIVNNTSSGGVSINGQGGGGIAIDSTTPTSGTATLTVTSSIVSGNVSASGRSDIAADTPVILNNSAVGVSTGFTFTGSAIVPFGTNLKLGALTNNGGPTLTHLPASDSPLIDRGSNAAGLTTDARGAGTNSASFPRSKGLTDIGAVEAVAGANTVYFTGSNVITDPNATPYSFTVTYYDPDGINAASIGNNDIRVTGPAGFDAFAVNTGFDTLTGTATYSIDAPGGTWDGNENGLYIIALAANAVTDSNSNSIPAQTLDTFGVSTLSNPLLVTNSNDSGPGSLRAALTVANLDPNADTIAFSSLFDTPQTIALTSGELPISESVTLTGPGANKLTITPSTSARIFNINNMNSVLNVTISGMKLTGASIAVPGSTASGYIGGAILSSNEIVTLDGLWLANNTATNGGGIDMSLNGGTLNILNSTLSGNTGTTHGGGVYLQCQTNETTLVIRNSTFFGNTAAGTVVAGLGGGVCLSNSIASTSVTIQNSTFVNNSAATGGGFRAATVATILNIESTVFDGNVASVAGPSIGVGTVNSNHSALGTTGSYTQGTSSADIVPGTTLNLGVLQNNGGPMPTHQPGTGSPLINAGSNPTSLPVDQRGLIRSFNQTDIGAVEVQPASATSFIVNGGTDQRSRITQVEVFFDSSVVPASYSNAGNIIFTRTAVSTTPTGVIGDTVETGPAAPNHITVTQGSSTSLILTFDNNGETSNSNAIGVESGSLTDGYWQLSVGTFSSTLGDLNLRRLYGDSTVNAGGTVNGADLVAFGNVFSTNSIAFDFNNDGTINGADLVSFGNRFSNTL
ncbi:hypothetical protein BH11PLA2_BH11PLA2_47110 [soil metagenome]